MFHGKDTNPRKKPASWKDAGSCWLHTADAGRLLLELVEAITAIGVYPGDASVKNGNAIVTFYTSSVKQRQVSSARDGIQLLSSCFGQQPGVVEIVEIR